MHLFSLWHHFGGQKDYMKCISVQFDSSLRTSQFTNSVSEMIIVPMGCILISARFLWLDIIVIYRYMYIATATLNARRIYMHNSVV